MHREIVALRRRAYGIISLDVFIFYDRSLVAKKGVYVLGPAWNLIRTLSYSPLTSFFFITLRYLYFLFRLPLPSQTISFFLDVNRYDILFRNWFNDRNFLSLYDSLHNSAYKYLTKYHMDSEKHNR